MFIFWPVKFKVVKALFLVNGRFLEVIFPRNCREPAWNLTVKIFTFLEKLCWRFYRGKVDCWSNFGPSLVKKSLEWFQSRIKTKNELSIKSSSFDAFSDKYWPIRGWNINVTFVTKTFLNCWWHKLTQSHVVTIIDNYLTLHFHICSKLSVLYFYISIRYSIWYSILGRPRRFSDHRIFNFKGSWSALQTVTIFQNNAENLPIRSE